MNKKNEEVIKDDKYVDFFNDDNDVKPNSKKGKEVIVANIVNNSWIIVNDNGNGTRIPLDPVKHKNIKLGDKIII
jgi:hypothetical protein